MSFLNKGGVIGVESSGEILYMGVDRDGVLKVSNGEFTFAYNDALVSQIDENLKAKVSHIFELSQVLYMRADENMLVGLFDALYRELMKVSDELDSVDSLEECIEGIRDHFKMLVVAKLSPGLTLLDGNSDLADIFSFREVLNEKVESGGDQFFMGLADDDSDAFSPEYRVEK